MEKVPVLLPHPRFAVHDVKAPGEGFSVDNTDLDLGVDLPPLLEDEGWHNVTLATNSPKNHNLLSILDLRDP
uniref:Uncharacterized protein n=1 Tax=Lepeophtheirus salmonis TaxID=72036 RepID=A0A0K2TY07_LEPSM